MGKKNKAAYNAYMREYMLARYHSRRNEALKKLGGKCSRCGSKDDLQIDHIDRRTKTLDLGKLWNVSKVRFDAEIEKCQLLCAECHSKKTIADLGKKEAKGQHGTRSSYKYCKCDECRKAQRDYFRRYRRKKRKKGSLV